MKLESAPLEAMKISNTIVISLAALSLSCGGAEKQTPSPQAPVETRAEPAPEPVEVAAEPERQITYHYRNGRTRAYLSLESSICREDETSDPVYEMKKLWRLDPDSNTWTPMDVAPEQRYRIACNAMLDLVNVLGYDLEMGNYAVEALIGGSAERDVFTVGEPECDENLGEAPAGKIAVCVVGQGASESRFVPDPAGLD